MMGGAGGINLAYSPTSPSYNTAIFDVAKPSSAIPGSDARKEENAQYEPNIYSDSDSNSAVDDE